MSYVKSIASASLMASLLTTAAHALTADQIWANWQENAAAAGLSLVSEGKTMDGDVLTLTGVTVGPAVPDGPEIEGSIAEITMTEGGDGVVTIAFAPEFTLPVTMGTDGGQLTVTHDGMTLTAREVDGGTAYDYTGASLALAADFAYQAEALDGSGSKDASFDGTFTFVNLAGTYTDMPGTNRKITVLHTSDSLDYTLSQVDPALDTTTEQTASISDVAVDLGVTMPATARLGDIKSGRAFSAALMDGLAVTLKMQQGDTVQTDKTDSMFLTYAAKVTSLPGTATFAMDKTGGGFAATGAGGTIEVTSPSFPFPVLNAVMGPIAMDLRMPLTGSDPVPFRYMISLDGLTVNEDAWAVVDPGKVLPRDPAKIMLDLTGKAAMDLGVLMDTDETGAAPDPMPMIETLDIAGLNLAVAGALLTGTGAFTFDNTIGIPMPRGAADVSLTGGNALIEGLVAIGIMPEDQAASARMMMSMFMAPGDGDDTMTSRIEARDDGGIYVNGQRVQ